MRSLDSTWRVWVEWALRAVALVVMVILLFRAFSPATSTRGVAQGSSAGLDASLRAWTVAPPVAAHIVLDSAPSLIARDWIAALRRAGTPLTWEGKTIPATAASLTRLVDPVAAWDLSVAAPRGSRVVIADVVGALDTVTAGVGGTRLSIAGTEGHVTAAVHGAIASAALADSAILKRLLVEGSAGWETKYTIAALAERGWSVDAITHVAPGVDVRLGTPSRPDTSRYAAVIAVDTSASLIASGATAFVRNGGGLITLRDAASIGPSGGASIVLERRPDGDVRAYRVGSGRVIRVGYKELWRRRMTNDDSLPDPVAAHRAWLANVVSSVAFAPRVAIARDVASDPAPLADIVGRLGRSSAAPTVHTTPVAALPNALLFALLMVALLLEWLSRRMRGAR